MTKVLHANWQANPDQVDTLLSYAQLLREVLPGSDAGAGSGRGEGGHGAGVYSTVSLWSRAKILSHAGCSSGMDCRVCGRKRVTGLWFSPSLTGHSRVDLMLGYATLCLTGGGRRVGRKVLKRVERVCSALLLCPAGMRLESQASDLRLLPLRVWRCRCEASTHGQTSCSGELPRCRYQ